MHQNSNFKKLMQISEEIFPPVHGSDCYIITQQDVRKIEESRFFSLSTLMPNGDLKSLNLAPESLVQLLKFNNLFDSQSTINNQNLLDFIDFICNKTNGCSKTQQRQQQNLPLFQTYSQCLPGPQPMEISSHQCPVTQHVASIEQQLKWDKCYNSALFPMTYSQGTSTTEIVGSNCKTPQNIQTFCNCCCCCQTYRDRNNTKSVTFSRGTYTSDSKKDCKTGTKNLGAREQLKQKKLRREFAYIS